MLSAALYDFTVDLLQDGDSRLPDRYERSRIFDASRPQIALKPYLDFPRQSL